MSRKCIHCQERLFGRADQKFCSDYCRNRFHNQKKKSAHHYFRKVNSILYRNRGILFIFHQQHRLTISWTELLEAGFDPNHCTAYQVNRNGSHRYYCYDMIYEPMGVNGENLQLSRLTNHGIIKGFYKKISS